MKKLYFLIIGFSLSLTGFAQSCLPEGIIFSTQAQIDNFQVNYPGCKEIEGDVIISGSDITNLNGLNPLTSFKGELIITDNNILTNLTGLENVTSIGGQLSTNHFVLTISKNPALTELTGLNNLTNIRGGLKIFNNQILSSLSGLESLSSIGGDLRIDHNLELTNLSGLEGLISIGGSLIIETSNNIESLIALANLTSISDDISICNTDITSLSGLEGLTSIFGNVFISGDFYLTDLTGLDNVTYIGGTLTIGEIAGIPNSSLTSLIGLNNVSSIGGSLLIYNNDALTSLTGLDNLTSIGGQLSIYANDALTILSGLEGLKSIGRYLEIDGNNVLTSLTALISLNTINGSLYIDNNPALSSLNGLDNIDAGSIFNLNIRSNQSLSTCEAQCICEYLSNPNGAVIIYGNNTGCNDPLEIAEHCGCSLPCLPHGNYYLFTQSEIDSFQSNYPTCFDIKGDVYIMGNDITNLKGLNNVTSIGGALFIQNNAYLNSLTGLESLVSIGSYLMIEDNLFLGSLSGLDNLIVGSLSILYVRHNPILSYCEVQGICNILAMDIETISIFYNASGCSNRAEVEAACGVGLNESNIAENHFTLSPNPSSTRITIETSALSPKFQISIFNLNGQEVISCQIAENKAVIDISNLPGGVYFVRMTGESAVGIEKFIKIK